MAIEIGQNGKWYGIGKIPRRKRPALYEMTPSYVQPVAYFNDEEAAARFADWLEELVTAKYEARARVQELEEMEDEEAGDQGEY